jgi:hypothetical protein
LDCQNEKRIFIYVAPPDDKHVDLNVDPDPSKESLLSRGLAEAWLIPIAIPRLNAARVTSRLVRSTNLPERRERDVAFSRANVIQPVERAQRTRLEPQRDVIHSTVHLPWREQSMTESGAPHGATDGGGGR